MEMDTKELEQEFAEAKFLYKCKKILDKGIRGLIDMGFSKEQAEQNAIDILVDILDIEDNRKTFENLYQKAIVDE